ncbi:MAG: hypothetical protein ABEJ77_06995 [Halanaeroarchaeum sp.]
MRAPETSIDDRLHLERSWPEPDESADGAAIALDATTGFVGDRLTVRCRGLDPGRSAEVRWHTVDGGWELRNHHDVVGPRFEETVEPIATVTPDRDGTATVEVTVPEDYGGEHAVELARGDRTLDVATVTVEPHFELATESAPLGDAVTLRAHGLGADPVRAVYQVTWDNGTVGYLSAIGNDGTATAPIRAVGPVGEHTLSIWRSVRGEPFLQTETQPHASPGGDGLGSVSGDRQRSFTVEVTTPERRPETAWMDPLPEESPVADHADVLDEETDATLSVDPVYGQAGTEVTLTGEGFPARETVELIWYRHEGHFAQGIPISPEPKPDVLPTLETDAEGAFAIDFEVPDDKGATTPIAAAIDGTNVATTAFMIQPSIAGISPEQGPVGTEIEIELSGLGWPIPEMSPYLTYDNRMVGYVCSEDDHRDHGITRTKLQASGRPGLHFIDVYPNVFETETEVPDIELMPHLSAQDAHPGRATPGIHFTFEVTE